MAEVTGKRGALNRQRVLDGAMAVADAGGLDALTIRSLAQHLHVAPMAIYHYVANKEEMLDGLVDLVFAEMAASRRSTSTGVPRCYPRCTSAREVLRRHPGRSRCCRRAPLRARRHCGTSTRSSAASGTPASRCG